MKQDLFLSKNRSLGFWKLFKAVSYFVQYNLLKLIVIYELINHKTNSFESEFYCNVRISILNRDQATYKLLCLSQQSDYRLETKIKSATITVDLSGGYIIAYAQLIAQILIVITSRIG